MFTCPSCEEQVNQATEVCPYCGANIAPAPPARTRAAQRKGLIVTLVGALALVAGVWGMVWYVLPKPSVAPPAIAEVRAIRALRRVEAIVTAYNRRAGGYPDTIQQVASEATPAYEAARSNGYYLVYQPGTPGSDGNIHTFVLLARPDYYGYRNFYVDQTGVIRFTTASRPADARDPPIS